MKTIYLILAFLTFYPVLNFSQSETKNNQDDSDEIFCGVKNTAFHSGEMVTMKIYYSTLGLYVGAGEARFTVNLTRFNGKPVYHCVGEGNTYSFFDHFFKVRDRYETYIDTSDMLPVKFIRNVDEGGYKIYNNVTFDHNNKYKKGDKIPFDMFIDDEIHHLYLRYEGKENIKTRYGKFRAIKFKPLLIKGSVFQGGEKMTVWISDDDNHLLLRAESPISVGSIKVDMMGYKNLRYPLKSLISVR